MDDSNRNELITPVKKKGIIKPPSNIFSIDNSHDKKFAHTKKVSFKIAAANDVKSSSG